MKEPLVVWLVSQWAVRAPGTSESSKESEKLIPLLVPP